MKTHWRLVCTHTWTHDAWSYRGRTKTSVLLFIANQWNIPTLLHLSFKCLICSLVGLLQKVCIYTANLSTSELLLVSAPKIIGNVGLDAFTGRPHVCTGLQRHDCCCLAASVWLWNKDAISRLNPCFRFELLDGQNSSDLKSPNSPNDRPKRPQKPSMIHDFRH